MATKLKKKRSTKKRKVGSKGARGLEATTLEDGTKPAAVEALRKQIVKDGGAVLATYRDPLGGKWQVIASLPVDNVEPTPYQRDLSETHVDKLTIAIDKLDRFLDPIIAVPSGHAGTYWSPNGYHRLGAMKQLGAKSITAIVVPEPDIAHKILALNTEKAHNLREKSMEVARLAEALAELDGGPEKNFANEFEEAAFITLGLCYRENGRFSGGAYHPILKRIDLFLADKLPKALEIRKKRAAQLIELNEYVNEAVKGLKAKGLESPYLKNFVVSRVNHLRWVKEKHPDYDDTMETIVKAAKRFNVANVRPDQVAKSGGGGSGGEE